VRAIGRLSSWPTAWPSRLGVVAMRWEQIDLKAGLVHVARLKNGLASPSDPRPRAPSAARAPARLSETPYLFVTERGRTHDAGDGAHINCRAPASSRSSPSLSIRTCSDTMSPPPDYICAEGERIVFSRELGGARRRASVDYAT